ncbi:MAG: SLBB domain-containing protein [Thermodesulfobacteriota bacterium]
MAWLLLAASPAGAQEGAAAIAQSPAVQAAVASGQVTPAQVQQGLQMLESGQISPEQAAAARERLAHGTLTPAEIETGRRLLEGARQSETASGAAPDATGGEAGPEQQRAPEGIVAGQPAFAQRMFGPAAKGLTIFGQDLFSRPAETFSPLRDVPVSEDYVVGPGDAIKVIMWGRLEGSYELEVTPEGEINFPKLGTLSVAGLTLREVKALISQQAESITGVSVSVSMGKLRTIQVFVLGEVKRPGLYSVSALATAVHALLAAGGPTPLGSLRGLELKRNGEITSRIDLYRFLQRGDISDDTRLMAGDVVFVPAVGPLVAVTGNVKRPGIYEMQGERTLQGVLALAGGLAPRAYNQRLQIERAFANQQEIILDIPYDTVEKQQPVPVADGDVVKVFSLMPVAANAVTLIGNVARPGEYAFRPGLRVRDVLPDVESLLPDAHYSYALIKRYHLQDMSTELIPFDLGALLAGVPGSHNIALQPMDEIHVFSKWAFEDKPKALIEGEVRKPGSYPVERMRVKDLIQKAGSLTETAYLAKAELIRTDEAQRQHTLYFDVAAALADDPQHNLAVQNLDRVRIHSVWEERWQEFASIDGEIKEPKAYPLTQGMRVKDLVFKAGGFTRDASMTTGHLYRTDWRTKEVTILTFELDKALAGDPDYNLILQDLDRVVVHSVWEYKEHHTVQAKGMLNKPGSYPYAANMTVRDLVLVAGSPREAAYLDRAEIVRYRIVDGRQVETSLVEINLRQALAGDLRHNIALQPWDVLTVKRIPEWGETAEVRISGEVNFPGSYTIRKGERLSSLIERAGGFTPLAYFRGARFTRESARVQQQERMSELVDRLAGELARGATQELTETLTKEDIEAEKQTMDAQRTLIERLRRIKATGRVVMKLAPGPGFADSEFDVLLEDGDDLHVPPVRRTVAVLGEVYNPTTLICGLEGTTITVALGQTGGPTKYAEEDEIYVIQADGSVHGKRQRGYVTTVFSSFEDRPLYPGDTLVVPPKLIHTSLKRDIKDVTSILYEMAVAAGIVITQVFD